MSITKKLNKTQIMFSHCEYHAAVKIVDKDAYMLI